MKEIIITEMDDGKMRIESKMNGLDGKIWGLTEYANKNNPIFLINTIKSLLGIEIET